MGPTTFKELKDHLGVHLHAGDVNQEVRSGQLLNEAYNRVVYDMEYPHLLREASFNTVVGTRRYVLSGLCMKPTHMRIPSKNIFLSKTSLYKLATHKPEYDVDTTTGTPEVWYMEDWVGVETQPAAGATLEVVSSDAADTGAAMTCTVQGVINDSAVGGLTPEEIDQEVVTLNGTTEVALTKTFKEIISFSKNLDTTGNVRLLTQSGNTHALLGPLYRTKRYLRIGLEAVPDEVLAVKYKYVPYMIPLRNDSDVPLMPQDDIMAIADAAMMYAAEYGSDQDLLAHRRKQYEEKIKKARERMGDTGTENTRWGWLGPVGGKRLPFLRPGDHDAFMRHLWYS